MAHMPCSCISQAFLALLLLWSSPCTNASASYPTLFLQSPDCGGYQCSVSGAFSDLPRLDQPLFTATASTTATSTPAANLNCPKTDRFFSGHGSSNNDSMAHMPCSCISQAFLALLLLWSSPCTNASASYPALFLQSPDCGGYQCSVSGAFSDLPRLDQPLFTATASTTATSIPAANLNCPKTDRFFNGHGSSNNDSMAHMPCSCISQEDALSFVNKQRDVFNKSSLMISFSMMVWWYRRTSFFDDYHYGMKCFTPEPAEIFTACKSHHSYRTDHYSHPQHTLFNYNKFAGYALGYDDPKTLQWKICAATKQFTDLEIGMALFNMEGEDSEGRCSSKTFFPKAHGYWRADGVSSYFRKTVNQPNFIDENLECPT